MITGALVVILLLVGSAFSFAAPNGLANGPNAHAEVADLTYSMRVPSGPYFLSELLPVDLTLANHSQTTYTLQGSPHYNACGGALWAGLTGGSRPHYQLPVGVHFGCPLITMDFTPGQTITIHDLVPLTASGQITLTAGMHIYTQGVGGDGPFADRWPALQLTVDSHVPANRTIALIPIGTSVLVVAPPGALAHLVYIYNVACYDEQGPGGTTSANGAWDSSALLLNQPGCPGKDPAWSYAVSAPGYAIASYATTPGPLFHAK